MSMIPKGGDTIWGGLDWFPEEGYSPGRKKQRNNDTQFSQSKNANYGRIISFGKDIAEAPSSEIEMIDFRVRLLLDWYSYSLFLVFGKQVCFMSYVIYYIIEFMNRKNKYRADI